MPGLRNAALRQAALAVYRDRRTGLRPAPLTEWRQKHVDWARLIEAIATRQDRDAFAQVFSHFAPRVKGMLIKLGATPELADDLAQETLLTVWRKADRFDPQTSAVAAWVYTIARNLRIDALRKARPTAPLDATAHEAIEDETPHPDQVLQARQDFRRVRQALAELPQDQRETLRNAYYLDMSQTDIADALGAPLGTVKSRVRLALQRLRTRLDDDNDG